MPYPSYTYMTDADALAIMSYSFSLAPVRSANRANTLGFPFDQRWLMGPWSLFFNENVRFRPSAAQSPEWNRGAYLAEALAHCGECHTPRNLAFALNNRKKFAGAVTAGWHAFNISSDRGSGIGAWNDKEIAAYLSDGPRARSRHGGGPDGRGRGPELQLAGAGGYQGSSRLSPQRPGGRFLGARNDRPSGSAFAQARR